MLLTDFYVKDDPYNRTTSLFAKQALRYADVSF